MFINTFRKFYFHVKNTKVYKKQARMFLFRIQNLKNAFYKNMFITIIIFYYIIDRLQ